MLSVSSQAKWIPAWYILGFSGDSSFVSVATATPAVTVGLVHCTSLITTLRHVLGYLILDYLQTELLYRQRLLLSGEGTIEGPVSTQLVVAFVQLGRSRFSEGDRQKVQLGAYKDQGAYRGLEL